MLKYRQTLVAFSVTLTALSFTACEQKKPAANAEAGKVNQTPETSQPVLISTNEPVSFNEHIQPILSEYCYHCHGPDSGSRQPEKNPLRLDIEKDAFVLRENGKPVIIKGKPDESYLIELVESKDKDLVMPPHPEKNPHGKLMKPEEIALLRRWITEGAVYEDHWAYIPPKKSDLPEVTNKEWAKDNPIDRFIAARFEKAGFKPNPQQEPTRLYRRLYLDLTGLPPAPQELEKLLADKRNFDTVYRETVDKLLKTDTYAEHWTRHWLDVARYADTHGIHIDNYRSIWPYRDWVLEAFRKNMPFDQFTREQIAGDMMPNATVEQIVATGFSRCLPTTGEGGAIAEEYNAIYAQDRVDTTASAWLGLTTGCAACHDHKFDAISTKENYQLTAFFRNTPMSALDRNNALHPPNIKVQSKEDKTRSQALAKEIPQLEKQLATRRKANEAVFQAWHKQQQSQPSAVVPVQGLTFEFPLSNQQFGLTDSAGNKHNSDAPVKWVPGISGDAAHLQNNAITIETAGHFERDKAFSYGAWIKLPHGGSGGIIAKTNAPSTYQGFDLWLEEKKLAVHLIHHWPHNYLKVRTKNPFPNNKWFHVMATYDGSSKAAGVKIYINGKSVPLEVTSDKLSKSINTTIPLRIGKRNKTQPVPNLQITGLQIYNRAITGQDTAKLAGTNLVKALLALPSPNSHQLKQIREYYFNAVDAKGIAIYKKIQTLKKEKQTIDNKAAVTLVMKENANKKPFAHILIRGNYADKSEKVTPDTPASLPPMGDLPRNRLGLAQWLTKPENPLPARVTVNRYWYYLFGRGIVETTGDFGVMGARPTHPELLDWLAVDFVENKWDLHHLLRTIVTSSTYRQSSRLNEKKLKVDPRNELLARGPRYRLDAEQIRDLALKASGLLHPQLGGPSVKPYQPKGIWSSVAMKESNTRFYEPDNGNKLYRRSLYTFWKRTAPHPAMEILNAPVRETSCVQRELTNTPLQAFVIMNDPQFVEASRHLAQRSMKEAQTPEARVNYIATSLLSRPMSNDELQVVLTTLKQAKEKFTQSPEDAKKLISVGASKADASLPASELAAWTVIANQILNMDETLNK